MSDRRFLLDENMDPAVGVGLRRRCPAVEVRSVGDGTAPPRGTPDGELLRWMEATGHSLVTFNRASMPIHLTDHLLAGGHVPGLFVFDTAASVGAIVKALHLVRDAAGPDEFRDDITHVPLSWCL